MVLNQRDDVERKNRIRDKPTFVVVCTAAKFTVNILSVILLASCLFSGASSITQLNTSF